MNFILFLSRAWKLKQVQPTCYHINFIGELITLTREVNLNSEQCGGDCRRDNVGRVDDGLSRDKCTCHRHRRRR